MNSYNSQTQMSCDRKLEERAQRWMNPDSVKYFLFLSLFSVFFF